MSIWSLFDEDTKEWFTRTLGQPTEVQKAAWPPIAAGKHALVSAPTGTGKTLASFLVFIDALLRQARQDSLKEELYLIYISPLKSLAGDIRENLRRPLHGIAPEKESRIRVAIRTGDTTQAERRRMIKHPPHILITTPESLYLLLTSKNGSSMLKTSKAIIIDELHALIDSKRGAHLMLSIARLDSLCGKPLQRIGLSATIEPLHVAAQYLAPEPVVIAAPAMHKNVDLAVTNPLSKRHVRMKDPVWKQLARTVYDRCQGKRSVIAFVEGRMYAEKLAFYVNELGGEGFARTHHGSLSKEQRLQVEDDLREGRLRLLCATSSMELGIDVGEVDEVFQIGCPRSISSTMQRLGRAGHNPHRTSVMHIFPRTVSEGLYSGMTAQVAREGGVEYSRPPRLCLDVLAQHLVSMAVGDGYTVEDVMVILKRAYPFKDVTQEDVKQVLCMLSGDYEHEQDLPVRPRLLYDRIHDRVEGDAYSRMLAVSAGGTIPDRGLYTVRTESGVKLGELDEEFIYEARDGDKFLLGTMAWRILRHDKNTVYVQSASPEGAKPPFWHGEYAGRSLRTGKAFGRILRELGEAAQEESSERLLDRLCALGLDDMLAQDAAEYIKRQIASTGILPDDRNILVEHCRDETGSDQLMVHSVFGRQVNAPLGLLVQQEARHRLNMNVSCVDEEDGFLLYPYGEESMPEGLLYQVRPDTARAILEALLPVTPLFSMTFRYNANRALMMGVRRMGRQPLWVQRIRSAQMLDTAISYEDHPLVRETKRECLENHWDLEGVEWVLNSIQAGTIAVHEIYTDTLSPMSLPLQWQVEASMMYDYSPIPRGAYREVEKSLSTAEMITPDPEQLEAVSQRNHLPEDAQQLHSLLMIEGDLVSGELPVPVEWLELLVQREQVCYIEPGLWIAAEQAAEYEAALINGEQEACRHILRRSLRYRGAQSEIQLAERYWLPVETVQELLSELVKSQVVVEADGMYYHGSLYDRARRATLQQRRQVQTVPASRYAAVMTSRVFQSAPPMEQLKRTLKLFEGQCYAVDFWETVILPGHVKRYRPELLDTLLSQGEMFWRLTKEGLVFLSYDAIDWEADVSDVCKMLTGNERILYEALLRRGASFLQSLTVLVTGEPALDVLLSMADRGLVCADSLAPVRQHRMDLQKMPVKQRARARAMTSIAGRWDVVRPILEVSPETKLERMLDRYLILSRETCTEMPWSEALEKLRILEYTGKLRRGYYVEGLSGAQFIREREYAGAIQALIQPSEDIQWISAADPCQPWGKLLPHKEGRSFMNVPGTAVALIGGEPVCVFERQGRGLQVFTECDLAVVLTKFVEAFRGGAIYRSQKRITVKDYPKEAAKALEEAGFRKEMLEYVLYR